MATITSPRSSSPAIPTITSPSVASGTNTPTSSVRHSIELPASQHTTNAATSNQRRNRAALRDYYNLKAKAAATAPTGTSPSASTHNLSRTGSVTSTTSDSTRVSTATLTTDGTLSTLPATLDDPDFDAEAYIKALLKTSSLKDILRTESSLVSEIRNLDGERKALVYDNYSKLIVAVSTIGEMQKGIVQERTQNGEQSGLVRMKGLEGKLDGLMEGFKDMSQREGNKLSRDQAERRKRERETRRQKDLVAWALSMPDRLEKLREDGKQQEAEKEWEELQIVLAKWEGVAGVDEIKESCQKIFKDESQEEDDDQGSPQNDGPSD